MDLYNPEYIKSICKYTEQGIPKIIHQIWINEDNRVMPENWKISPVEWKKYHSDYIYILWDRDNSRKFIEKYYPDYLKFYDNYKYTIQRCDAIRYFFLYEFGGIYSDLDDYPLENLEKYLIENVDNYIVESWTGKGLSNNLMIIKRGSELFKNCILNLKDKPPFYSFLNKELYVLHTAGPLYLQRIMKKVRNNTYALPAKRFNSYNKSYDNLEKRKDNISIMSTEGYSWSDNLKNTSKILKYIKQNIVSIIFLILVIIFVILYFIFINNKIYNYVPV